MHQDDIEWAREELAHLRARNAGDDERADEIEERVAALSRAADYLSDLVDAGEQGTRAGDMPEATSFSAMTIFDRYLLVETRVTELGDEARDIRLRIEERQ